MTRIKYSKKLWYHQYECLQGIKSEHSIKAEYSLKTLFVSIGYSYEVYEGNWNDFIAAGFCSIVLGISFYIPLPSMQHLKHSKCTRRDKTVFHSLSQG